MIYRKYFHKRKKPETIKSTDDVSLLSITPGSADNTEILESCKALETDLVELTNTGPCCGHCAKYRNRIFSISGKDKRFPLFPKDYQPGCCLSAYPFVEGVMEPSFSAPDIIAYSNRPFVDERTFAEKEHYAEWEKMMKTGIANQKPVPPLEESQPTSSASPIFSEDYDELLDQSAMIIFETNIASVSMLQRRLHLGYARAARIIDQLEEIGVIGPFEGSNPRQIIMSKNEYLTKRQEIFASKSANKNKEINIDKIIRDEEEWRRQQYASELDFIDHMDGHQFEQWCADLLRKNGFSNVEVTAGSSDQGVDIIAVKDGVYYAIQCKCYTSDIGNKPVQEVYAGKEIYNCQVGVVMTNRHFTSGAKELAKKTRVLLWDRDKLEEMLRQ